MKNIRKRLRTARTRRLRRERMKFWRPEIEQLEARQLLFADPFFSAASYTEAANLTLRITQADGVETLTLVDDADGELATTPLSEITGAVRIVGSDFEDYLHLDIDTGTVAAEISLGVVFEAGAGNDALQGPDATTTWNVVGVNSGNLGGTGVFDFASVESLVGGATSDLFVIADQGSLSLGIDGGDSEDTLVGPDAEVNWTILGSNAWSIDGIAAFAGIEVLAGGDQNDTLDYSGYGAGVSVDLGRATAEGDFVVLGFEAVQGSEYADTLVGDEFDNSLVGFGGNDTLTGGPGDDTYVFTPNWGEDTIEELEGAQDGEGLDIFDFTAVLSDLTVKILDDSEFTFSTDGNTITTTTDSLFGLELAELTGGVNPNVIDASSFTGLTRETPLSLLNDGAGVAVGAGDGVEIVFPDGTSVAVDLAGAETLGDIFDAITSAAGGTSPGISTSIDSSAVTFSSAAANTSEAATQEVVFDSIVRTEDTQVLALSGFLDTTALTNLNNGDGVGVVSGTDFLINLTDGEIVAVDLSTAVTVRDVFDLIEDAADTQVSEGRLSVRLTAEGTSIVLDDEVDAGGNLTVTAFNASSAAADLGLEGIGYEDILIGDDFTEVSGDLRVMVDRRHAASISTSSTSPTSTR